MTAACVSPGWKISPETCRSALHSSGSKAVTPGSPSNVQPIVFVTNKRILQSQPLGMGSAVARGGQQLLRQKGNLVLQRHCPSFICDRNQVVKTCRPTYLACECAAALWFSFASPPPVVTLTSCFLRSCVHLKWFYLTWGLVRAIPTLTPCARVARVSRPHL